MAKSQKNTIYISYSIYPWINTVRAITRFFQKNDSGKVDIKAGILILPNSLNKKEGEYLSVL
jgi:hypothetical protein